MITCLKIFELERAPSSLGIIQLLWNILIHPLSWPLQKLTSLLRAKWMKAKSWRFTSNWIKKSCCCWISHFIENGVAYSFYVRTRKFDFRPSVLIFQRWPRLKMFLLSSCLKFELSPSFAACASSKMIFIESNKFSALASKLCNT